jgi:hypothetical protein
MTTPPSATMFASSAFEPSAPAPTSFGARPFEPASAFLRRGARGFFFVAAMSSLS